MIKFHSAIFIRQVQVAEASLLYFCMLCQRSLFLLSHSLVQRLGEGTIDVDAMFFGYAPEGHVGKCLANVILIDRRAPRDVARRGISMNRALPSLLTS